jgi:drug/metabolite transporter (DMT)-like permease
VYGKRILTRYNPMTVIAWVYLLTSLFQLPFVLWQAPKQSWPEISVWNWFAVGYSALGSLFLANTLYYFAVERIGPSRVGVYTNLSPIFTLLLAALIGGERITSAQIAGLAIIVSGIAVSNYRSQEHSCPCTHPPAPPL